MDSFVLGVFPDSGKAKSAVETLQSVGFTKDEISVLVKDNSSVGIEEGHGSVAGGAAAGATTGGALGALGGLLVGLGVLAIPGIGPLLAGGPLLASLGLTGAAASTAVGAAAGAATGAVVGGLSGALVKAGVSAEDAEFYEQQLAEGAVLVGVGTDRISAETATQTLAAQGADHLTAVG